MRNMSVHGVRGPAVSKVGYQTPARTELANASEEFVCRQSNHKKERKKYAGASAFLFNQEFQQAPVARE